MKIYIGEQLPLTSFHSLLPRPQISTYIGKKDLMRELIFPTPSYHILCAFSFYTSRSMPEAPYHHPSVASSQIFMYTVMTFPVCRKTMLYYMPLSMKSRSLSTQFL